MAGRKKCISEVDECEGCLHLLLACYLSRSLFVVRVVCIIAAHRLHLLYLHLLLLASCYPHTAWRTLTLPQAAVPADLHTPAPAALTLLRHTCCLLREV